MKKLFNAFLDKIFIFYKFFRKFILLIFLFLFSLILFSNLIIFFYSGDKIFYNISDLSNKKTALVLGTAKYVRGNTGLVNIFYSERIKKANELFESGKVEFLILSGTNDSPYYNEPAVMKKDLMSLGVPEDKIFLDYAGFRTLDSVLRAREIFSQTDLIIISQKFHLQRAIFIAGLNGIKAEGLIAPDPPFELSFKTYLREIFSRIKLLKDILFKTEPRFYGEKVDIL